MSDNLTSWEKSSIGAAIVCGILGAVLGVLGYSQGCHANKSADKANDLAVTALRLQSETDLRPYVWMDWITPQVTEKLPKQELTYYFRNTGKSAAHNFRSLKVIAKDKYVREASDKVESDVYQLLYPGESSFAGADLDLFRWTPSYLHSCLMYEYHLPSSQLGRDSILTMVRLETRLIRLYGDSIVASSGLGSSDTALYGSVEHCSVHFEQPRYYITDVR